MQLLGHIGKHPDIDKILIVGPNGNIGKALIPQLLELGYKVRALQFSSEVPKRAGQEIVMGGTLDREAVAAAMEGVDAVCHMIRPVTDSAPGEDWGDKWFNGCIRGTYHLLEAAKGQELVRFVNGSADNVFGHATMKHIGPIDENHPKFPADDYYGLFKIVEEQMLDQYHALFGIPTVILRFGWIWRQALVEIGAGCLDKENQKIRRRMDIDGRPHVRQDVHLDDVVQSILLALEKEAALGEDFCIASPAAYSSEELCEVLKEKWDWEVEDTPSEFNSWTTSSYKAQNVLGYRPGVELLGWLREELGKLG